MLYRNRLALNELKICCFSITEGYTRAERNGSLSSRQTLAHTRKSHSAVFPITNGTLPLFFFFSSHCLRSNVRVHCFLWSHQCQEVKKKRASPLKKNHKKKAECVVCVFWAVQLACFRCESYLTRSHPWLSSNKNHHTTPNEWQFFHSRRQSTMWCW